MHIIRKNMYTHEKYAIKHYLCVFKQTLLNKDRHM